MRFYDLRFPLVPKTRISNALGNDGRAAGYYEDSEGKHHGIVLENGELRQQDFPGSVETEIYGISDATGVLTGNWIDAAGVRRGFTGDIILEFPGQQRHSPILSLGRQYVRQLHRY